MNSSPYFSIVIPTFNSADFLKRAISSVFAQSFKDFEIIVIDNSSKDHTNEVLESFNHPSLKMITVNNFGVIAYSRNIGIEHSNGQWIAFLDSDDVWGPEKLEKVRKIIEFKDNIIAVCHDEWHVNNGKRIKRLRYGPAGEDLYKRLLFMGNCLSTSAVSLRKDVALKTGGFSEKKEYITVEDYEYWIRLSNEGIIFFIEDVLGEWHTHGNNYSSNAKIHADALIAVKEDHLNQWLKKYPNTYKMVKRSRARTWLDASRCLLKGNCFIDARRYVYESIKLYPYDWKALITIIQSIIHLPTLRAY